MTVLVLQFGYLVLAVGYNLVSLSLKRRGGRPLAPTDIRAALIVFGVYALMLAAGFLGHDLLYRVVAAAFAVFLGLTGVVPHVVRGPGEQYRSRAAWLTAILVNIVGVGVTLAGVVFGPGG